MACRRHRRRICLDRACRAESRTSATSRPTQTESYPPEVAAVAVVTLCLGV